MGTSINDGPGCLMLRCPDPSCAVAVGQDMINLLASAEDKEKYARYFLRSYVEDNRKVLLDTLWSLLACEVLLHANLYAQPCFVQKFMPSYAAVSLRMREIFDEILALLYFAIRLQFF